MNKCGAKTRAGTPCKRAPVEGGKRCKLHGGATPRGIASPHFKTGTHTKYLPTRMVAAYEAALNDPELLDLNGSIALIDARLLDLLTRVDTGESGAMWAEVVKSYRDVRKAYRGGDHLTTLKAFAAMDTVIDSAMQDYAAWSEVSRLLDDRRKHVETKQRIETTGERAISASELMTFMGAVMQLIQTTVSNKREKQQIADGMERLITPRGAAIQ